MRQDYTFMHSLVVGEDYRDTERFYYPGLCRHQRVQLISSLIIARMVVYFVLKLYVKAKLIIQNW